MKQNYPASMPNISKYRDCCLLSIGTALSNIYHNELISAEIVEDLWNQHLPLSSTSSIAGYSYKPLILNMIHYRQLLDTVYTLSPYQAWLTFEALLFPIIRHYSSLSNTFILIQNRNHFYNSQSQKYQFFWYPGINSMISASHDHQPIINSMIHSSDLISLSSA